MGLNRYLYDKIVREGTITPIVPTDYTPGYEAEKIRNIWTDYEYRSKSGAGSGWGYFEITDSNKWIDFDEGGGELNAAVATGEYDATSLCAAIKTAMEGVGALTYTPSISDTSRKFTIAASGGYTLLCNSGSNKANAIWDTIGFDDSSDKTGSSTYTGEYQRIHTHAAIIVESHDQATVSTKACALFGLNLTSSYQTLKLQRWTGSAWEDVGDFTYNYAKKKAIIQFTEKTATKYRILVTDRENPQGYIQIGAIILGDYKEISRGYEYGGSHDLDDTSAHQYTKKGYLNVIRGFDVDIEAIVYEVLAADETKLEDLYKLVGKHYPLVFIRDSADALNTMKYIIFSGKFSRRTRGYLFKTIGLVFTEVR